MTLGNHSYFNGIDHGSNTRIGNFTSIAEGVYVHGPDNRAIIANPNLVSTFDFGNLGADFTPTVGKGGVWIGSDVWIGEGAQILDGVLIGDGAIIGAHTVVSKFVPEFSVCVGNPFLIKRYRYSLDQIRKLLRLKWWDWSDEKIKENIDDFRDINTFLEKHYKP